MMRNYPRILTKLTLIPIHFAGSYLFPCKKEKRIWKLSDLQRELLKKKWNNVINTNPKLTIQKDKELIFYIKEETKKHNQNNITRTAAYLTYYKRNPEIHWSFLAHIVSRNAGYFMTDLKGEFLPHILTDEFITKLYFILEKGNSLIFQDAYPQLLLYEESKKRKRSFFHLCKFFQISSFMEGVWELFFDGDHSPLLPVAQIINEQNLIERLLVQKQDFQQLINRLPYKTQEWLKLTQIVLPTVPFSHPKGETMNKFTDLTDRIQIGKSLYQLLFTKNNEITVFRFASSTPHTGSRSDYDPYLFTANKTDDYPKPIEKLSFFKIKHSYRLYSPYLNEVWKHFYRGPFLPSDWFNDPAHILQNINLIKKTSSFPVWISHWATLHKLETGYLLKKYYNWLKKE